jgi:uncharacterized BrkB/YihY/UPF0761 family membrane protein
MKTLLLILLLFVSISAIVSGILLIISPDGGILSLPPDLLTDTPFRNFLLPGIILACIVGGTNLFAVYYNLKKHPRRYGWAITGGVVMIGWIVAQITLVRTLNWLQFVYISVGVLVILIAWQLKGKWIV